LLESDGFEVGLAVDGTEGLARHRAGRFDVVLCELDLPDLSGYQVCREIRDDGSGDEVPVVLLTDFRNTEDVLEGLRCGAHHFVNRPYDADYLRRRVRSLAERRPAAGAFRDEWLELAPDRQRVLDFLSCAGEICGGGRLDRREQELEEARRRAEAEASFLRAEQARTQEEIERRAAEALQSVIAHNVDGIVVLNRDGLVLFVNPAAETLFGRDSTELLGRPFPYPWSGLETTEIEIELPEEGRRPVEMRIVESRWEGQEAYLASLRDLTERRQAESLQQRLLHTDRLAAIGQLAAGVAHEINNPAAFVMANLSAAKDYVEQLRWVLDEVLRIAREETDADRRERLESALHRYDLQEILEDLRDVVRENFEGMERIRSIVKDLRTFARIEQNDIDLINLNEVVDTACNLVYNEIRHRARLIKDVRELPLLPGDRGKLAQVITNLLVNAAHAIPEGATDRNHIRISTTSADGVVFLDMEDTGPGIPDSIRERLFEPFFTTKSRGKGTGLGLSLSAEIVRKHKGQIYLASGPGEPTRFRIELPLENGLTAPERKAPQIPTPAADRPGRILVIDDEQQLLKAFQRVLAPHYQVVVAGGGAEGIDILAADGAFDLVLCDLMMPEVDGRAVHEYLAREFPERLERLVFCTGGAFTPAMKQFIGTVENLVLEKPVTPELLRGVAARMCRR
jgi:signal transduction histidine kinase